MATRTLDRPPSARTAATRTSAAIPETMLAAAIARFGPPGAIRPRHLPVPELDEGEGLIALHAAGVGSWDKAIREGAWRPKGRPRFPLVLGLDGAGVVVARAPDVRRFKIGDRVWAYDYANRKGGFYAEYAAVSAELVGPVPDRLNLHEAGTAAVTALTALQGIDDMLHVRKGETVLVVGASGAVGSNAVQFAKRKGATVIGTATGRAAQNAVRRLGADFVVDARREDAAQRLQDMAPDGLDAALVLAGGEAAERCLDLLKEHGRIAHPEGIEPEPRRRRGIPRLSYNAEAGPREFVRLNRAVDEARLQVAIAGTYPLSQAARSHERLERGRIVGRLALRIRRGG
jgi:NADPH:quinone reductase